MVVKTLKFGLASIYAVCALLLILFALPISGWKALDVLTGSMHPAIPQGSLVIIHRAPPAGLHVGDVVTYESLPNPRVTITHRIVGETTKAGALYLTTKGDANTVADPQFVAGRVVGRVQYHIPGLGSMFRLLTRPLGLALVLGLPALLIIISEIQLMMRRLQDLAVQEERERQAKLQAQEAAARAAQNPERPRPPQPGRPRVRPIIRAVLPLAAVVTLMAALGVGATRAAWTSQATLAGNTISVAPAGGGNGTGGGGSTGSGSCPTGTIFIGSTGAGSVNIIKCKSKTTNKVITITITNVTNTNEQSTGSGNVTTTGNGAAGGGSGNTDNSTTTKTTTTNNN